ncbi:MAG: hypothetical protein F6J89_11745 [Symploca sp. SIO1C4]|uniref:Uncharacterized protein n=1 Tax=Symploca sp. SIO1C4 TaxID=2607765 RepID=A0A6B3N9E1_9CYAN|nr:hypothetical protein [Symploca sp. SIO1C4]
MIISNLSYLEVVEESNVVGAGYYKNFAADVDVDLDIYSDVDLDFDKYVDTNVNADVDVTGNSAFFFGEATALGDNSTAELDVVLFASDDVAEVTSTGYVATY